MKIFLDFDDSLFNTRKFRGKLIEIFLKNGVSRKDFFGTYYDYPQKTPSGLKKYSPNRQIKLLEKRLNINSAKIRKDLQKLVKNTKQFVFSDARDFLKSFKKSNLYLVSYGYTNFQREKIKNCGLIREFRSVVISDGNKNEVVKRFAGKKENFVFVDDRVENISNVKKHFPGSLTFLLKRKEGRYNDKRGKAVDFEAKNLKEVKTIIKKEF